MNRFGSAAILSLLLVGAVGAETFRAKVAGRLSVDEKAPEGSSISLSYIDSVVIALDGDKRFIRGVELDLRVPQQYLKYKGSIAASLYASLKRVPPAGVADLSAERIGFVPLPNKLQSVFHIPIRKDHGIKASPYAAVPTGVVPPADFPLLFKLMPVIKGLPEEIESMGFQLYARPILTDEGALKIDFQYPEKLKDKPFTLLVDDEVVPNPSAEILLGRGEHTLSVISEHYRNEIRRFDIEQAKVLKMAIGLQDPTPIVVVEAPENAQVFFDDQELATPRQPFAADPGEHSVRFVVGDYSLTKRISVNRGRNYRVVLAIDVTVDESE